MTMKSAYRDIDPGPGLALVARLILGSLFVYASIDKVAYPDAFVRIVQNYRLLPTPLTHLFSIVLPWVELCCGVFLLAGVRVRANALIIAGMLAMFIVAVTINLARGLDMSCGCFTVDGGRQLGFALLVEDMILFALGLLVLFVGDRAVTIRGLAARLLGRRGALAGD